VSIEVERLWLSLSTLQAAFDSAVRELRAVAIAAKETAAERDAARLELRALEWLQESEWFFGVHWGRHAGTIWTRPRRDEPRSDLHANWSEAARALGWEG
jgi:hypothetical protein